MRYFMVTKKHVIHSRGRQGTVNCHFRFKQLINTNFKVSSSGTFVISNNWICRINLVFIYRTIIIIINIIIIITIIIIIIITIIIISIIIIIIIIMATARLLFTRF